MEFKDLTGTVLPFSYNDISEIANIIKNNDLAAIIMEVERSTPPLIGYLEEIRELCDRNNIVLIFDEISSGFRETLGGLHLKYSVEPDMCIFGKALGNGYAITAVLGKEIMQTAQETFISSTFWTERIGPTAALKTLEIMQKTESYKKITNLGIYLKKLGRELLINIIWKSFKKVFLHLPVLILLAQMLLHIKHYYPRNA